MAQEYFLSNFNRKQNIKKKNLGFYRAIKAEGRTAKCHAIS